MHLIPLAIMLGVLVAAVIAIRRALINHK